MHQADRIIICPDNEPEGWNIYWRLNSYYQVCGQIHRTATARRLV